MYLTQARNTGLAYLRWAPHCLAAVGACPIGAGEAVDILFLGGRGRGLGSLFDHLRVLLKSKISHFFN